MRLVTLLLLSSLTVGALGGNLCCEGSTTNTFTRLEDTVRKGGDLGSPLTRTTAKLCAESCAAQGACVAFVFHRRKKMCFMKQKLKKKRPRDNFDLYELDKDSSVTSSCNSC